MLQTQRPRFTFVSVLLALAALTLAIAVGIFQSLTDSISAYQTGVANRDAWIARDGCPNTAATEPGVQYEAARYAPCNGGVEVDWRVYVGYSHLWPTGADATDIRERMWALFQRNPRP